MADLTVIILTKDEEKNLPKALASIKPFAERVVVVDCGSQDKTLDIARFNGCDVYFHEWETYAKQFNWALDNTDIKTNWVMRLDADEEVMPDLAKEIENRLPVLQSGISGINVKRRIMFMGKWIRHGGIYPTWLLRIFRKNKALCEQKIMDEHIVLLEGREISFKKGDIIDHNNKPLNWWVDKHNWYSDRECEELLRMEELKKNGIWIKPSLFGSYNQRKRWIKENLYNKMPLGFRAYMYYIYRYYFRLGFLDGKEGQIFHFLQGYWYRYLVDAKVVESIINERASINK